MFESSSLLANSRLWRWSFYPFLSRNMPLAAARHENAQQLVASLYVSLCFTGFWLWLRLLLVLLLVVDYFGGWAWLVFWCFDLWSCRFVSTVRSVGNNSLGFSAVLVLWDGLHLLCSSPPPFPDDHGERNWFGDLWGILVRVYVFIQLGPIVISHVKVLVRYKGDGILLYAAMSWELSEFFMALVVSLLGQIIMSSSWCDSPLYPVLYCLVLDCTEACFNTMGVWHLFWNFGL